MAEFATKNREDALEVVQDTMFKLVQRYAERPADEWTPLFYRILQSRINDWHRRHTVRERVRGWLGYKHDDEGTETDPFQEVPDPRAHGPAEQFSRERTATAMIAAVEKLSLRQQQAFLLRSWEGLSIEETAYAMGCSEGSVKTHYARAVRALQELLREYQP